MDINDIKINIIQVDSHIHELRKARNGWIKKLEASNYASTEALEYILKINHKIEALKSLFPLEFSSEPTVQEIEDRSKRWTRFVPNSLSEF